MTQEEKNLLLKDLCGRLPYVTYVRIVEPGCLDKSESVTEGCVGGYSNTRMCQDYSMDDIFEFIESGGTVKPYLRPMSNMTMEEFQGLRRICPHAIFNQTNNPEWIVGISGSDYGRTSRVDEISRFMDWLNARHFDFRGLIEMGLALEAPEGMYN